MMRIMILCTLFKANTADLNQFRHPSSHNLPSLKQLQWQWWWRLFFTKPNVFFSGGVPLPLPPPETEVFRSPGSLHHPRPLHHLEPAGCPGGILNSHLALTWLLAYLVLGEKDQTQQGCWGGEEEPCLLNLFSHLEHQTCKVMSDNLYLCISF